MSERGSNPEKAQYRSSFLSDGAYMDLLEAGDSAFAVVDPMPTAEELEQWLYPPDPYLVDDVDEL